MQQVKGSFRAVLLNGCSGPTPAPHSAFQPTRIDRHRESAGTQHPNPGPPIVGQCFDRSFCCESGGSDLQAEAAGLEPLRWVSCPCKRIAQVTPGTPQEEKACWSAPNEKPVTIEARASRLMAWALHVSAIRTGTLHDFVLFCHRPPRTSPP